MAHSLTSANDEVSHYPLCFGCGEINPKSMGLKAFREGDLLRAEWTPPAMTEGGPGIVHGGYLAAAVDEMQALLASSVSKVPAMTVEIQVRYLSPVLSGHVLTLEAEVVERKGRKLSVAMRAVDRDGDTVCFTGTGTYVAVPSHYWSRQAEKLGIDIAMMDFEGGDISTFFAWHVRWLRDAYRPRGDTRPARILVEFDDVEPARWLMSVDSSGLRFEPDPAADAAAEVSIGIRFQIWQEMLKERTEQSNASGVVTKLDGRLTGDEAALNRFVSQLPQ